LLRVQRRTASRISAFIFGAAAFFLLESWTFADGTASGDGRKITTPHSSIWEAGVGDGFRKYAKEAGFSFGGGPGLRVFGGRDHHNIVVGDLHFGTMISGPVGTNSFLPGNFELLADLFGGEQFNGETAYVVGIAPLVRYNFVTRSPLVPFIGCGGGASLTDIRRPDLSTDFEFNVQVEVGTHWFFKSNMSATLEGRWLHLSNGGIDHPNQGVNSSIVLLGVNWFF
jgi:lipid A 3-O-deacylase